MTDKIVVLVTCGNKEEAGKLALSLLERKLVACVNLIPAIQSWYWWEGKINQNEEALLIMKTVQANFVALEKAIRPLHSYAVPEIVALPITAGFEGYLRWVENAVCKTTE
jgi:periplasmic divalent cation tolerance protein